MWAKVEQNIKKIDEGKRNYELRFIKSFKSTFDAAMVTEGAFKNTIVVKSGFCGK